MKWTLEYNEHTFTVKETMVRSYFALVLTCDTCDMTLGTFDQVCFPKYRLAFNTARDWAQRHAWHGPNHGPEV